MIKLLIFLPVLLFLLDYKATKNKIYLYIIPVFYLACVLVVFLFKIALLNAVPILGVVFLIYLVLSKKKQITKN